MTNAPINTTSHKLKRFQYLSEGRFTGVLKIQAPTNKWSVLFTKGKIVWAIDSIYPHRFWQRQLLTHLPHNSLQHLATIAQSLEIDQEIQPEISWPYFALAKLYLDGQIDSQKLGSLLADGAQDILFDILQSSHTTELNYSTENYRLPQPPPIIMAFEKLIIIPLRNWQEWQNSQLTDIFPGNVPIIDHPPVLYQQTNTIIYNKLTQVIDGSSSIREIAIQQQQDLFLFARSLLPHLQQQTMSLHPLLQDLPKPDVEIEPESVAAPVEPKKTFTPLTSSELVVYIDDNACANEYMAEMVTSIGYQFFGIKDPNEVIDILERKQPQLIMMEAAMPLASGRQICQQIRRSNSLSKIPVVLVVDRENLSERILAKLAGASSIITHPIDQDKVSKLIKRYLGSSTSTSASS
jgi:two-component system, chemotaxis family, response regulator PixG